MLAGSLIGLNWIGLDYVSLNTSSCFLLFVFHFISLFMLRSSCVDRQAFENFLEVFLRWHKASSASRSASRCVHALHKAVYLGARTDLPRLDATDVDHAVATGCSVRMPSETEMSLHPVHATAHQGAQGGQRGHPGVVGLLHGPEQSDEPPCSDLPPSLDDVRRPRRPPPLDNASCSDGSLLHDPPPPVGPPPPFDPPPFDPPPFDPPPFDPPPFDPPPFEPPPSS